MKFTFFLCLSIPAFIHGQALFKPDEAYNRIAARAMRHYKEKNYKKSALSYDSLFVKSKGLGPEGDTYNAACSWALAGNADKAFFYLKEAVVTGKWSHLDHLLSDTDLSALHADMRWQPLVDSVKVNKEKKEGRLNKPLVALLDTIYREDQGERNKIDTVLKQYGWQSKQMDSMWKKIVRQDSVNLRRVRKIIDSCGWLGPDAVGQQGAMTLFLVIQHADSLTQVTYLPKMRDAVKKGKAMPQDLALLEDRILTKQGKEQLYGSQVLRNEATGKNEFFPIKDESNVNKRRKSVGLGPLEEYAKYFDIEYRLPEAK